jgi:N-acetylneuraminic acid mutarotase
MMKQRLLPGSLLGCLLGFAFISLSATAQTTASNEWTWMGGSSLTDQPGVYGTLGKAATTNIPGSRSHAASWTDSEGNFWLFGGFGYDANGNPNILNDFWEFNPSLNQWTWVGGGNTGGQVGNAGTLGVPSANNIPGGRFDAVSWTDSSGNLWLFGGEGVYGVHQNDLWEFSPLAGKWTWVSGSITADAPGVYGTQGLPASNNVPAARWGAAGWSDSNGNLWLFGGSSPSGELNDLWEFNTTTKEWVWMAGSSFAGSIYGPPGVYGVLGSPAAGNSPSGRDSAATWIDGNGNFWLFGGEGNDPRGQVYWQLNDVWEFFPSTNEWAWMGGNSTAGTPGIYGAQGMPASGNIPGPRDQSSIWTDNSGDFWVFGGRGEETGPWVGELNDLWSFNPLTNEWAWIGGPSSLPCSYCVQPGVYGTLGTPAAQNIPGGRNGAASWTDSAGYLWLFGGYQINASGQYDHLSDLWKYQPYPEAATPTFSEPAGTYATTQTVTISDTTPGATIYCTTDGTLPTRSSAVCSGGITVSSTETIEAIAMAKGYVASAVATATYTIAPAATPTFSPAPGTYSTAQTVTISDATPGATIYYTTNGTAPTTGSTVYSSAITVGTSETIEAIAVAPGMSQSAVATAAYTITPDFSIAASPTALTVNSGSSGTASITVTPLYGFDSAVSFSCSSGLPAGASCSFSPQTVTPPGATSTTLTVTTSSATASLHRGSGPLFPATALGAVLCCFGWKKRRPLRMLLLVAVSAAALSSLSACGGGSSNSQAAPVTSTVTVTATSGTLQHATTFSVTVN